MISISTLVKFFGKDWVTNHLTSPARLFLRSSSVYMQGVCVLQPRNHLDADNNSDNDKNDRDSMNE